VVIRVAVVGYLQPSIENVVYLQFQKDESGPHHYRKKLMSEGFAKEFADRDFCGCRSRLHVTLGQTLINRDGMINLREEFSKNGLRFPKLPCVSGQSFLVTAQLTLTNCTFSGVLTVLGAPCPSPLRVLPVSSNCRIQNLIVLAEGIDSVRGMPKCIRKALCVAITE
jgi:hypothetical protein